MNDGPAHYSVTATALMQTQENPFHNKASSTSSTGVKKKTIEYAIGIGRLEGLRLPSSSLVIFFEIPYKRYQRDVAGAGNLSFSEIN